MKVIKYGRETNQSIDINEAIRNGDHFYWDEEAISEGRSGGSVCPKCRKWIQPARKRKNPQGTYLMDCESCEIKDPFKRLWHKFNGACNDEEREIYNSWLREVRSLSGELNLSSKSKLHELICKVPFFEGV